MKKSILSIAVATALISGTMFTSCQSSAQKADDAKANVQEAKQDLKEAEKDATVAVQKAANAEELKAFKSESDIKIKDNEMRIAELKAKMKASGKKLDAAYVKSIDDLEQQNKDMKIRVDNYGKDTKSDWEAFKREFNHDMDGLGQALKDLGTNNKK